jgi:thiamine pyrophosphate-dependent acetolactate synthase large subunit-like protein
MGMTVADLLVDTLQAAGVKTCYGIVGDTARAALHGKADDLGEMVVENIP